MEKCPRQRTSSASASHGGQEGLVPETRSVSKPPGRGDENHDQVSCRRRSFKPPRRGAALRQLSRRPGASRPARREVLEVVVVGAVRSQDTRIGDK